MNRPYFHKGFTLLELLIVVAIIAILSAIAIPNFLSAQLRSKIARVNEEMQTVATALESYKVDNGIYPDYNHPLDVILVYEHFLPFSLTTPVSYITTIPQDIFSTAHPRSPSSPIKQPYYYFTEDFSQGDVTGTLALNGTNVPEAKWLLWSYGPDLFNNGGTPLYDPTNGVISIGDLDRYGP